MGDVATIPHISPLICKYSEYLCTRQPYLMINFENKDNNLEGKYKRGFLGK